MKLQEFGVHPPARAIGRKDMSRDHDPTPQPRSPRPASITMMRHRADPDVQEHDFGLTQSGIIVIQPSEDAPIGGATERREWVRSIGTFQKDREMKIRPIADGGILRTSLLCAFLLCAATVSTSAQERPGAPETVTSGSQDVLIGGHPVARQGDTTTGGNLIVEGSKNVFINGKPAAIAGDKTSCGGIVVGGHGGVFINGRPVARAGDPTSDCPGK
jgi:uncharacterized Zn-binding protein involved in type VI secretion